MPVLWPLTSLRQSGFLGCAETPISIVFFLGGGLGGVPVFGPSCQKRFIYTNISLFFFSVVLPSFFS